jgi:hypothetical protein
LFLSSEQVVDALVGVLLDEVHHTLIGCISASSSAVLYLGLDTHLGHDWLAILVLYVSERHLSAFMFAELQVGVIGVRDVAKGVF